MSEFKRQFDVAAGKAASILSEQTGKAAEFIAGKKDKATEFFAETKDKAVEYLDNKKEIYETKTALDAAKAKVENLFAELGRISFYGAAVTPERKRPLVKAELSEAIEEAEALQEKYDALYPVEDSAEEEDFEESEE